MAGQQLLLEYGEAIKRRDDALAKVAKRYAGWQKLALAALRNILHTLPEEFPAEAIRVRIAPLCGSPSPYVWGSLVKNALKEGLIAETGKLTAMRSVKSHGRRTMIYQKTKG